LLHCHSVTLTELALTGQIEVKLIEAVEPTRGHQEGVRGGAHELRDELIVSGAATVVIELAREKGDISDAKVRAQIADECPNVVDPLRLPIVGFTLVVGPDLPSATTPTLV
jgi:hypothetical protein